MLPSKDPAASVARSLAPPSEHGPAVPSWFMPVSALFLVMLTLLAYANSFHAQFSLDNALVLLGDTRLRDWSWRDHLQQIFYENYWYPSFPSELFRPLTTITYAANWSGPDMQRMGVYLSSHLGVKLLVWLGGLGLAYLVAHLITRRWWQAVPVAILLVGFVMLPHWSLFGNGKDPYGYHVTNFLLHAVNASLVLVVARRLTGRPWLALLAAAIFAVHPVEVESVTNIVGRADELATLWILVGFWCYLRATVAGLFRIVWLFGLGLAALCAMYSKEDGIMLLPLLMLYDFIFRWPKLVGSWIERFSAGVVEFFLKGWIALAPAMVFFFVMRKVLFVASPIYGELFIDNPIARAGWFSGEMTAFKVLGRYLGLLVYPSTLSCDYSYNQIPLYGEGAPLWEDIQCWIGLGVVLTLLGFAWFRRREQPLFSFGVFFFFGMLLPTANIVFPIGSIMAERFLYLPSIGFCLIAASALRPLGEKLANLMSMSEGRRAWAGLALPLVLLLALSLRTLARNDDWSTEFSLWHSAVAAAPNSFKVHKGLANGYWNGTHTEAGIDDDIARAEVGLAVIDASPLPSQRQDNTLFCDLGMYYNIKAEFLMNRNEPTEAHRFYQKGVDVMIRARDVDTWVNVASREAQLKRGRKLDEIPDVGNPRVHLQLAQSYIGLREYAEAANSADYARHLAPLNPRAYLLLGMAQANNSQLDNAGVTLLEALMVDQGNEETWNSLKQVFRMMGQNPIPIEDPPSGGHSVNIQNPVVHKDISLAAAAIMKALIDQKDYTDAEQFGERALAPAGYNVPAALLPPIPPTPVPDDIWSELHVKMAKWFAGPKQTQPMAPPAPPASAPGVDRKAEPGIDLKGYSTPSSSQPGVERK